jgi:cytoskeletal protein RodZ
MLPEFMGIDNVYGVSTLFKKKKKKNEKEEKEEEEKKNKKKKMKKKKKNSWTSLEWALHYLSAYCLKLISF